MFEGVLINYGSGMLPSNQQQFKTKFSQIFNKLCGLIVAMELNNETLPFISIIATLLSLGIMFN